MSYLSSEQSVATGRPIEAYDIAMGDTHWRITPNFEGFSYGGYLYSPAICKRTKIEQTSEIPKDSIELELPRDHELSDIISRGVPEEEISLIIYRGHGTDFVTFWRGYLTSVSLKEDDVVLCRFAPLSSDLPSVGMRRPIQRLCPHILYGSRCAVDKELFKVTGIIDAVNGLAVNSSTFAEAIWSSRYSPSGQSVIYGDLTNLEGCIYNANSYSGNSRYHWNAAFDDNVGYPGWLSQENGVNEWISCQWTSGKIINRIRIQPCPWVDYYKWSVKNLKVEASNNGSTWTKIPVNDWIANCSPYNVDEVTVDLQRNYTTWAEFGLDNVYEYTYYRLYCYVSWGGHSLPMQGTVYYLGIGEIEMTYNNTQPGDYPEITNGLGSGGLFIVGNSKRMIMSHEGETITLDRTIPDLSAGQSFTAYAGCDHSPNTCRFKFDNIENYGGLEFLPVANPYTSNIYY